MPRVPNVRKSESKPFQWPKKKTSNEHDATKPDKPAKTRKTPKDKPDRVYTDTVMTIKPQFAEMIANREKNYEYRKYELRETVERLWLYETAPTSCITYVMETTRPKRPGEVNDPSGVGNDDFDAGLKQSKFGYPVLGLYKLPTPISSTQLKATYVEDIRLEDMEKIF
ncbi:hypothetical protein EUX98_g1266 [Antrodiella citrinella]|uniref:Uncharacterized protein n=1 Tax=Antrodiella citrinella TaxID=2447956 RepID=A0A4S4N472_9APHY|nr:hypothetical protein EUX98_g1266 [Antrodiella citrinella]